MRSTLIVVVLLILTRLLGKKQMSQLTYFNYITGVTMGSVAGDFISEVNMPVVDALASLIAICILTELNSFIALKSTSYRKVMDGDDIMHIDRLKIQYAIMQEYPDVKVCRTWMNSIGTYSQTNGLLSTLSGLVEQPLLKFTKGNFLFHPTTMIRMDFLKKNALKYENCPYAEDFKFWV